ncbi:glutathione S-transferase 1-1 [Tribolium castaneum]|uniref:Glutathione S-transferase D4-like Protein n=1 Tax=Tribolium castaneum TaxID=7070 RepID=D6WCV2_TRICA|nr:PREDICTED: glutathione S-transferase 1-1 [Tribolium castaneum]EEZ99064.1 Glutathione S-transferase D4-like Protein [Tribolium castaneum]|eukprot:XP_966787.1 PREDICTED: glutathione S-transferase 1-1 [Tribolium castaneum]
MAITLYMVAPSPAVRAVQITAKALGIELKEKPLNFLEGEHLKPEYLKINPQHTVPTIVEDDGFTLWDSNAINAYLVSKYGKNDSLYPKDLKKRALVDQRLHFNNGVAFATGLKIIGAILRAGKTTIDDKDQEDLNRVYAFIEAFLEGKQWIAGDCVTIADYNLYATVSAMNVLVPIDGKKYPKVAAWYKKVDALPEVEVSKKGLGMFEAMIKGKLK